MKKYPEYKKLDLSAISKEVLKFWNDKKIFQKSVDTEGTHEACTRPIGAAETAAVRSKFVSLRLTHLFKQITISGFGFLQSPSNTHNFSDCCANKKGAA